MNGLFFEVLALVYATSEYFENTKYIKLGILSLTIIELAILN